MRYCWSCKSSLTERYQQKFCSNKCQWNYQYRQWILEWTKGLRSGGVGITAKNISNHLRRYLGEKYGNQCSSCGWSKEHPVTKTTPLEVDHVDGNAENNLEENLRLLCPNCHALTSSYKNLNRGKGRRWRVDKYIRN